MILKIVRQILDFAPRYSRVEALEFSSYASQRDACYSQKFLGYLQTESQRAPHRFPQYSDLSNLLRNSPVALGPGWDENQIAGAKSAFFTFFVDHESFAGQEKNGLILRVMPFERSGRAFPNDNRGRPVVTRNQLISARLWRASQNPFLRDRLRL